MLFLDWCEQNRERGPRLLKEWTGLDENRKPIDIKKITHGSHKKVLWQDEFEHEWVAEIKGRINGRNCPECARKRNAKHKNSLSTWCSNNTEQGQIIINGWTGISEDGQHYTMNEVSYGSNIKMLWRDEFNHEWYREVKHKLGICKCTEKATFINESAADIQSRIDNKKIWYPNITEEELHARCVMETLNIKYYRYDEGSYDSKLQKINGSRYTPVVIK